MKLTLLREPTIGASTFGVLFVDGRFECFTLEDALREGPKVHGETAIPAGTYGVQVTFSPRFRRRLPLLLGVPGFEGIRIHPGNHHEDTEGCILVGLRRHVEGRAVLESRIAMAPLQLKLEQPGPHTITIHDPGVL